MRGEAYQKQNIVHTTRGQRGNSVAQVGVSYTKTEVPHEMYNSKHSSRATSKTYLMWTWGASIYSSSDSTDEISRIS